jgi:cyclopropane-fatty-acyl-phospholipid synthase
VGVTLSRGQAASCRRNGLDVHYVDVRELTPQTLGMFDAVVSIGSFEAFCSREEYEAGQQDAVYANLFRRLHDVLQVGGRFFLQTMVFGRNMIPPEQIDPRATPRSDAHALAAMAAQFPGSWLPFGREQIERVAAPFFSPVSAVSGRLDYIETIRQWEIRFGAFGFRKMLVLLSLAPRYFTSSRFRLAFKSGYSPNSVCFQRELLDHFRLVFQRVD